MDGVAVRYPVMKSHETLGLVDYYNASSPDGNIKKYFSFGTAVSVDRDGCAAIEN